MKKSSIKLTGYIVVVFLLFPCCNGSYYFDVESFKSKGYTHEEILFFCDIAFWRKDKILKWETDINVEVANIHTLDREARDEVDSIISILAPLVHPLTIQRVESGGNLIIHRHLDGYPFTEKEYMNYTGFASINRGKRLRNIIHAEIYEAWNTNNAHTLLHEMLHAIGLSHPSKIYPFPLNINSPEAPAMFKSLDDLFAFTDKKHPLTEQEKKVIKMLYSADIRSGLKKSLFMKKMGIKDEE